MNDSSNSAGIPALQGGEDVNVPDFTGNQFFNTLGNLALEPRAGLLFIDHACGDAL